MPKCNYCGNEVPSSVRDYSCEHCGAFLCTSCYYQTNGCCYNCQIQMSQGQTPSVQYQEQQSIQDIAGEQVYQFDIPKTEEGIEKISGALDELIDLASTAETLKVRKTQSQEPINPNINLLQQEQELIQQPELLEEVLNQGELLNQKEEYQDWSRNGQKIYDEHAIRNATPDVVGYVPDTIPKKSSLEIDEQAIRDSAPDLVGYIPETGRTKKIQSSSLGGPQDQQDYVPEGVKKRRNLQFDEQAIRDSAPDIVGYVTPKKESAGMKTFGIGGPQDQENYIPEGIKKRRQMEFDEQAIRDSAPDMVGYVTPKKESAGMKTFGIGGPQDQEDYIPEGIKKRRQMEFDEQAIRDSAPDLISSAPFRKSKKKGEIEDWRPGDTQEDWIPEELKTRRRQLEVDMESIRNSADNYIPKDLKAKRDQLEVDMQKIRESVDDYIPKELIEKRRELEVDMDKIRDSAHDYVPNHLKEKRKQLEVDMQVIRDSADNYVPKDLVEKRKQIEVDMEKIRDSASDYTPEEYTKRKKQLEVDMENIRQQADYHVPEELKAKRRTLEVDMAKIRDSADNYIPEELKLRKKELEVDMEKIRQEARDYIPEELKAQRRQLEVDMDKIRDVAEDFIPEEIKRKREKIEVDMQVIRNAAQDYMPEALQKIRYEFDEDAIRQADDIIPEEYKDVKRYKEKINSPSFLKYGTTEELVAEDDDLLKSLAHDRKNRLVYDEDLGQKIREAEDIIPEEFKRRKIKKGKPILQSGYTYEKIDDELKKKWENSGSVIIDKSQIKKVEYQLNDTARDVATDVIPEEIKKIKYQFDEDAIRDAEDVIPKDFHKVQYELKDNAREAAADFVPEEVKYIRKELLKTDGPTFSQVEQEMAEEWKEGGVSDVKKPKIKSYFEELEEQAKGTTISKVDKDGTISSFTISKEKKQIDLQQISEALRSKTTEGEDLLTSKPFPGRTKVEEQNRKVDQLEIFMFLTFLGKLLFHPTIIKEKLL
ncbi:MAG: hypothetical protein EAX96_05685 [Candidatus Lokiarchaeota archaeon]|nr:hypothetical protein [Candidatus Lokiarchaeota archaeon]